MSVIKAFVDQINGDKALIILGENEQLKILIPQKWLPPSVNEGDWLNLTFTIDKNKTEKAKSEAKSLIEKLRKQKK